MKIIYLDHNATTAVADEVLEAMTPYFKQIFGNASSLHRFGREASIVLEKSRETIAEALSARAEEIYFTSGGTEADNWAIKGIALANRKKGNHINTSKIEHHAVLHTCQYLEKNGVKVTYLPVDQYGVIELDALKNEITDQTILISVMPANNEVGTIEPIEKIGELAKEQGIYFHTDAVQSFTKLPIDVNKMNIDLLSLSRHKIYGPKGIGALYIRKGVKIEPFHHGGDHERRKRAGTENIPSVVGLAKATEIGLQNMAAEKERLTQLRNQLQAGILAKIKNVRINGHPEKRLAGTLSVCFEYIEGESVILGLDGKGVAVSSGSACTSDSLEPSYVLIAMGVVPATAQGSVRFSLGRENTEEDIGYVLEQLPAIVERLRAMSPFSEQAPFTTEAGPQH